MSEERTALRRQLRAARRAIPASERIAAAEHLAAQLFQLPFAPQTGAVAGYWAVDGEIALHAWQTRLPSGCTYCLPVLHEDGRLRFAPWHPGAALVTNQHGIPEPDVTENALLEPEAMALVVLPLVGFDARGHRLGMGAGWYDRSFAFRQSTKAPPWLVGAAFSLQLTDALVPASWDVAMDAACSERETHLFEASPA